LNGYFNSNHLSNVFQSAYKQFHSIESPPLHDISLNINTGQVTALTLFLSSRSSLERHIGHITHLDPLILNKSVSINKNKKRYVRGSSHVLRGATNLLVPSLRPSFIVALHHHTLYVILVLHPVILISENIFLWHVAAATIIFVIFAVFVAIRFFKSPKPLLQESLQVGLISALHLGIVQNLIVFKIAYLEMSHSFLIMFHS